MSTSATEGTEVFAEPKAERWRELSDALDTERRLLAELVRVLLEQRNGISTNDTEVLDDSVYSAQRVLLTLRQARLRRRSLLHILTGHDEPKLTELEDAFPEVPSFIVQARDRLSAAAAEVQRQLGINRNAMQGAIGTGDRLIRALAGARQESPLYHRNAESASGSQSGALLDRQV